MLAIQTVLDMAHDTAEYIKQQNSKGHAFVTRAELNTRFKTTSNMKIQQVLNEALLNLLHYKWVHKNFCEDTSTVRFWCSTRLVPGYATSLTPSAIQQREVKFPDLYYIALNPSEILTETKKFVGETASAEVDADENDDSDYVDGASTVIEDSPPKTDKTVPSMNVSVPVNAYKGALTQASVAMIEDHKKTYGNLRSPKTRLDLFRRVVSMNSLDKLQLEGELRNFFSLYVVAKTLDTLVNDEQLVIKKIEGRNQYALPGFDYTRTSNLPKFSVTPPPAPKAPQKQPDPVTPAPPPVTPSPAPTPPIPAPVVSASDAELFARFSQLTAQDKALVNLLISRLEFKP